MFLTKEERRTLFRFLALYLGSSFILFAVIAYLFYQNERSAYLESARIQMQIKASQLSSKIIHAHMSQTPFSFEQEILNSKDKLGFYTKDNNKISSNIKENINFHRLFSQEGGKMILVDKSAFEHLAVHSIVIVKEGIGFFIADLGSEILLILLIIYLLLALVGYWLAKLFIQPIQMKRVQLDNFIKDSTHELNTPVSALMLSVTAPKVDSPKNLERIRLSAIRISEIHKDLSYLMLDCNSYQVEELLNLNRLIKEELQYLILLAEKKKINLHLYEKGQLEFKMDKESFIRLFHNLVSNAIKYNRIEGKIDITLASDTLVIQDTGIGIPKKEQKEIYKRFYRATKQVGGFGLGLNIVYKVCQRYGIKITVDSKIDKGTTFMLKF